MFGIGAGEFVLILIVGLIVFGPSKLPEFGRSLGKLIRELKKTQATLSNAINLEEPPKPAATPSTSTASATTTSNLNSQQNNVDSKVVDTSKTTSHAELSDSTSTSETKSNQLTSTQELIQLADSNPIRLDKDNITNSNANSSKEHSDK